MKNWSMPEVIELNLAETQYGGKEVAEFDNVYVNAEGNWEATFIPTEQKS